MLPCLEVVAMLPCLEVVAMLPFREVVVPTLLEQEAMLPCLEVAMLPFREVVVPFLGLVVVPTLLELVLALIVGGTLSPHSVAGLALLATMLQDA